MGVIPPVTQRKIIYKKKGRWDSREKLVREIAAFFSASAEQIETAKETVKWAESLTGEENVWDADKYYLEFRDYAIDTLGWAPPYTKAESNDRHGPQLPTNSGVKKPTVSVLHSAENTFSFSRKTLGRAQVIHQGKVVFDITKSSEGIHAEPQMIMFINAFVAESKHDWGELKIRITINNFPCDDSGHQCGKAIAQWASEKRMKEIHVYYANRYEGNSRNGSSASWAYMKACKIPINLTPFKAEEYLTIEEFGVRAKATFRPLAAIGKRADPLSDSENEDADEKHKKPRIAAPEPGPRPEEVHGDGSVDDVIVRSVVDFISKTGYATDRQVVVVSGENWTCYIRCVLLHFKQTDKYDTVIRKIQEEGLDISSGVAVGGATENQIIGIISAAIGTTFYVEATDALHNHAAQSSTQEGEKVSLLLTGAHFSLLR